MTSVYTAGGGTVVPFEPLEYVILMQCEQTLEYIVTRAGGLISLIYKELFDNNLGQIKNTTEVSLSLDSLSFLRSCSMRGDAVAIVTKTQTYTSSRCVARVNPCARQ